MKPNFALSLSFDGLRLMHRVPGGWELVGEVALDDADLTGSLARLRTAAAQLEPGGLATKLLLPNDQIKYLALDTTFAGDDEVAEALAGATPYALDELAFDYAKGGGRTYIAAVARETLAEAEAFATEHEFNPVSFVGVPEPFTYVGEPFFGAASAAGGVEVERDDTSVVVIGHSPVALGEPDVTATPEPQAEPQAEPQPEPQAEPEVVETPETDPADTATPDTLPGTPDGPEVAVFGSRREATPEDTPAADDPDGAPEAEGDADVPLSEDAPLQAEVEVATGDDVDRAGDGTALSDLTETEPSENEPIGAEPDDLPPLEPSPDDPSLDEPSGAEPVSPPPVFGSRRDPGVGRVDPPPLAAPVMAPEAAPTDGPRLTATAADDVPAAGDQPILAETPAIPEDAPAVTGQAATALPEEDSPRVAAASLTARREVEPAPADQAPDEAAPAGGVAGALGLVGGMFRSRRMARKATPEPAPAADERSRMTVFGARKPPKPKRVVGGKPRFLGLILTVALIVVMLAVAALAAMNEETISRWFGWDAPEVQTAAATPDPAAPEVAAPPASTPDTPLASDVDPQAVDALGADQVAQPVGQVLSPAEAERIYAATGVWQRAPRIPNSPRTSDEALALAVSGGFETPARRLPGGLPASGAVGQDPVIAAPINPPPPSAVFDFGTDGRVVATPEGALTPDGILVIAGRPALNPPTRPGTVAPEVAPLDRLASVVPEDAAPIDDAPDGLLVIAGRPAVTPPVRPGTQAPVVEAPAPTPDTAEGPRDTAAEEGLNVIAGRPPLEPPVRPGTQAPDPQPPATDLAEAVTDPASPEGLNVIAGRPPLEPPVRPGTQAPSASPPADDLASDLAAADPAADAPPPGGVALTALTPDTPRPRARPASVAALASTPVLGALTRSEAAAFRPRQRPAGLVPEAADALAVEEPATETAAAPETPEDPGTGLQLSDQIAAAVQEAATRPDPFASATAQAPAASLRPDTRPRNMARIVARANEAREQQVATAAAVARPVAPSGPTTASVAAAATEENAINLREINLIGVYGSDSDRRALVRLANGRYQRVTRGDRLDGGRVQSISANTLVYVKRGRTITLQVGG